MHTEWHYAYRDLRERELAERRHFALAAHHRLSPRARLVRMLFTLALAVEEHEARRMSSEARSRT